MTRVTSMQDLCLWLGQDCTYVMVRITLISMPWLGKLLFNSTFGECLLGESTLGKCFFKKRFSATIVFETILLKTGEKLAV